MLGFLASLVSGILNVLNSFLPDSPLQGWIESSDAVVTGLGWLNWFFPLSECLTIFAAYCALLLVVVGVRLALGKSFDLVGKLVGS